MEHYDLLSHIGLSTNTLFKIKDNNNFKMSKTNPPQKEECNYPIRDTQRQVVRLREEAAYTICSPEVLSKAVIPMRMLPPGIL